MVAFSSGNHARGVAIAARAARHPGGDRDASRCAAGEDRRHARRGRRNRLLRPGAARAARRSPRRSPPKPERRWCRASTTRRSSRGRARSGSKSSSRWPRRPAAYYHPVRRRRTRVGNRAWPARRPRSSRRAGGLGRHGPLARGRRDRAGEPDAPPTFCDALQTPRVSPITFDILERRSAKRCAVSDEEVEAAIRFAWEEHGLVVEPGGAVGAGGAARGQGSSRARARS